MIETDPSWWNTVGKETPVGFIFSSPEVMANEGETATIHIMGGSATNATSVKVYLTYNTAVAADVDLKTAAVDSSTGGSPVHDGGANAQAARSTNLKFPIALNWAAGEVGEKVITIPVKTDKAVEDDEFFTLQLANAQGMELGEDRVCTVTIHDPGYDALAAKIADGSASKAEKSAWEKLQKAKAPYIRGLADPANAGKVKGSGLCAAGKKVTLKASANKGFVFVGWMRDGDSGTGGYSSTGGSPVQEGDSSMGGSPVQESDSSTGGSPVQGGDENAQAARSTRGAVSLTIDAKGKMSGKVLGDGLTYTLAAPYYSGFAVLDDGEGISSNFFADVTASWSYKEGSKTVKTNEVVRMTVQDNGVGGVATGGAAAWGHAALPDDGGFVETALPAWVAWQYNWTVEPWKTLGKAFEKKVLVYAIRADGSFIDGEEAEAVALDANVTGRVTLKFSAKGTASVSGEFVTGYDSKKTVKATASATLVPVDEEHGAVFIYLTPKGLTPHARCVDVLWP